LEIIELNGQKMDKKMGKNDPKKVAENFGFWLKISVFG
jgi:hypothetical protein